MSESFHIFVSHGTHLSESRHTDAGSGGDEANDEAGERNEGQERT